MIADTEASNDVAACVNFLHTPQPPMSPYRLTICLTVLGWPISELARRLHQHRNTIQRWVDGKSPVDPATAAWLEKLTAFHIANPSPAASKLVIDAAPPA